MINLEVDRMSKIFGPDLPYLGPNSFPIVGAKVLAGYLPLGGLFNFHATLRGHGPQPICPLADEHGSNAKFVGQDALRTMMFRVVNEFHASTIAICFCPVNSKLHIPNKSILLLNDRMTTSKELRIENLRALVREFRTADAVAQLAGTAPMYLSQILNGAKSSTGTPRGVGDALARKLESGCGKELGWLDRRHEEEGNAPLTMGQAMQLMPGSMPVRLTDAADQNFYAIPKVKLQLSAGITGFQTIPEIHDGSTLMVPKNWVDRNGYNPSRLIALSVKGESMEPNLYDGDQVIVNVADTKLEDGVVFAVNYEGESVIKRLTRDRGEWWLTSDNQDQRKFHRKGCRHGECIIVGRVVRRETDRI